MTHFLDRSPPSPLFLPHPKGTPVRASHSCAQNLYISRKKKGEVMCYAHQAADGFGATTDPPVSKCTPGHRYPQPHPTPQHSLCCAKASAVKTSESLSGKRVRALACPRQSNGWHQPSKEPGKRQNEHRLGGRVEDRTAQSCQTAHVVLLDN